MVNMCSKLSVQIFPKHTGSSRTLLIICKGLCPKLDIAILRPLLSLLFWQKAAWMPKLVVHTFQCSPKVLPALLFVLALLFMWQWTAWELIWLRACLTKIKFSPLAVRKIKHHYSELCTAITCVQRYQTFVSKWGVFLFLENKMEWNPLYKIMMFYVEPGSVQC